MHIRQIQLIIVFITLILCLYSTFTMNFQILSPIILFLFSLYGILVGIETIQKQQKQIGVISIGLSMFTIIFVIPFILFY
ncbi:hypothetical protein CN272_07465 [Bacillus anthracis]|uniref:hypothetical protein n=1 Tax=Bacillus TaxID=1386 RepID=UPI00041B1B83|nr:MULTISPECIES: hypothetical protein [Bacillus cereus group]OTY50088.1 hypothetical protein BK748_25620 [Bacillus thuringiensis serovar graciosensis]PFC89523.1 hypothetical protein CN272_07465 [Bacillus anthracis]AXY06403.1 hypothetical protein CUC43_05345 [Bacillus thuringiensis LM1212]KXY81297.1 hypothetical protein AT270_13705 [Bacillus cereus]MBG9838950.1 hypothetical protein [Bacillus tropicus]